MGQFVRKIICFLIKSYQYLVSPYLGSCCRFYPSCSQYALSALHHYSVSKGLWLACCRLCRCHPWNDGGYDPILPNKEKL